MEQVMKQLILASVFALPLVIAATAGSPAFAQDAGPARPDQGYLPPGSWPPGTTGSAYSVWGAAYVAADGCTYQDRYEKGIDDAEPHVVQTVLVACPPPPVVENPPPAPTTGTNTTVDRPPPPPPPPPVEPPAEPPTKPKPITGFVDPPAPPPPVEPSRWERFKRWCKSFLECQDEATEKKEHDEALRKAIEERRAEMRKEHDQRTENANPGEKAKTRELKQESKLDNGKTLKNLHTQNRLERASASRPEKSNLHSMKAMSRVHNFGRGMGARSAGGSHGLGGMRGFGGMHAGRLSMR
jgi:hypothetical protein